MLEARDLEVCVTVVLDDAMNYALAHNRISPLKRVVVENGSGEALHDLRLEIELDGPVAGRIAAPFGSMLPEIDAGESRTLSAAGLPWRSTPALSRSSMRPLRHR